jgi:hypothetical protein
MSFFGASAGTALADVENACHLCNQILDESQNQYLTNKYPNKYLFRWHHPCTSFYTDKLEHKQTILSLLILSQISKQIKLHTYIPGNQGYP